MKVCEMTNSASLIPPSKISQARYLPLCPFALLPL